MKWFDNLLRLSRPHFGQPVTWLLLAVALVLASLPVEYASGVRIGPATSISWLPSAWLGAPLLYEIVRWTLIVAALLWILQLAVPWSCWVTVIAFTLLWALRMENATGAAHTFNLTNMLLLIHAMWYSFYAPQIRASLQAGAFWSTPLYPRWAFVLGVFSVGLFHTLAGLSKIIHSGPDWGDGLSLQLWVEFDGWEGSPFGQLILANRTFAAVVQTSALVFETIAILALFSRRLRVVIAVGLLGFYAGVLTTFVDYGFHINAVIVALYFLPADRLAERIYAWGNARFAPRPMRRPAGMWGRITQAAAARLDVFQVYRPAENEGDSAG